MVFKKTLNHIVVLVSLACYCFLFVNQSYAQNASAYNGIRFTSGNRCDSDISDEADANGNILTKEPCYTSSYDENNYECALGDFKFDPFTSIDLDWNLGNETCIGYVTGVAVSLFAAFSACRLLCPSPQSAQQQASDAEKIKTALDKIIQANKTTFQKVSEQAYETARTASSGGAGAQSVASNMTMIIDPFAVIEIGIFSFRCSTLAESTNCCTAAASCGAAYLASIGVLGGIFETAKSAFQHIKICGEGYKVFERDPVTKIYSKNDGPYAKFLKSCFLGQANDKLTYDENKRNLNRSYSNYFYSQQGLSLQNSKPKCDNVLGANTPTKIKNTYYREFSFKGIEYQDNGIGACDNPKWIDSDEILGYSGGKQRYYYAGPGETPNYACGRFLAKGIEDDEGFKAYECCNRRSQSTICLERYDSGHQSNNYLFCSEGSRECSASFDKFQPAVKYKIFESVNNPKYLCARSYSVCPYDHNVAGGTDLPDEYTNRPSIITNFCQYMRHCVKKPPLAKFQVANTGGYFFAESCLNMVGDSQLINGLESLKFSPTKSRNFSTPIVQCIAETLQNNFMGVVGRTICKDGDSYANNNGKCISFVSKNETEVLYQKGQKIQISVFQKIQNQLRNVVRFALIFSVLFFGFQILLAVPEMHVNRKTVSVFLVKFGLVSFFALGNAWQGFFVDSVLNASSEISNITFQPNPINDGCIFPKFSYKELNDRRSRTFVNANNYSQDPISYPPTKNYLRIWDTLDCKLARAVGYGPDVTTSNLAKMIFAGFISGPLGITFFFAAFAYGFLLLSIILRAIHITIMSLLGVILLIYVSPITITCSLFERTKGIFENWWKQLLGFILQPMILFAYLGLLLTIFDFIFIGDAKFTPSNSKYDLPALSCDDWTDPQTNIEKKPSDNSIYCIFNFPKFKNYTGLELFDLAIPVLTSLNKDKINTIFRAAILMFVFFNFLDKISLLASKLVGGAELNSESSNDLKNKLKKFAKGVQKRALNGSLNAVSKGVGMAKSKIRSQSSKNENVSTDVDNQDSGKSGKADSSGFTNRD